MKGKLVYTAIVEKEIEIPDEVITAYDKIMTSWDDDAYALIEKFSEKTWESIDNVESRLSIQVEQDSDWWALEEY